MEQGTGLRPETGRSVLSYFRWAFAVTAVGILLGAWLGWVTTGTAAGTLAIMVDTIGFCGRFFAEAMEDTDTGPREALTAIGGSRTGMIFSAVIPQAMPSFINTSLFSLEKATRSSVVLGLVGAGGIGQVLFESIRGFYYAETAAILIVVVITVTIVDLISQQLRKLVI